VRGNPLLDVGDARQYGGMPDGYDLDFLPTRIPLPQPTQDATALAYPRFTVLLDTDRRLAAVTGVNIDGALLVDPSPARTERLGGYGALGYTPSVIPWLRAFVGYGSFPGTSGSLLFRIEVDARLTGWLY